MKNPRRLFLNQVAGIAGIAALNRPLASIASVSKHINTIYSADRAITIYNTNDLHGNIDAGYNNPGGVKLIKALLEDQDTSGLLVDAGDFLNSAHSSSQHKEIIRNMNGMGYCAATPGNHELALGQANLALLIPLMKFAMVNCNYRFDATLSSLIKPYIIVNTGKFKVGITGVGQPVNGVIYKDAIECANQTAQWLKTEQNCDLVICLSHLGYKNEGDKPDNKKLARQSEHIDMIVGGHNRKVLRGPMVVLNKQKQEVILSQACWDGLMMGKTVFDFEASQKSYIKAKHFLSGDSSNDRFIASVRALRLKEKAA
jgi:5'-nucleotidase